MASPARAPDAKRILCVGMVVRDLIFHVPDLPPRGDKEHASRFQELAGGNALNAAVGIARLGGEVLFSGPMGDAADKQDKYVFDQLDGEGIDHSGVVHMPGLVTPISATPSYGRSACPTRTGFWRDAPQC
jgi:sulfofructose kinase